MRGQAMIIGYTAGAFDLFHVGHLNILRNARAMCDRLVVGVSTDELIIACKRKKPVILFEERMEVVRSIRYVDAVVAQENMDKMAMWERLRFDLMFVGDDWRGTRKWQDYEEQFRRVGVRIVYFPYTQHTSSSLLRDALDRLNRPELTPVPSVPVEVRPRSAAPLHAGASEYECLDGVKA
jgi:glycerol-3-phosphate cytidylyltransferase